MKRISVWFCIVVLLIGCGRGTSATQTGTASDYHKTGSLELKYATQYSVDYYEGGYAYIKIADGNEYVWIPEGKEDTNLGYTNATLIRQASSYIYLAATAAMDLFCELDALDSIVACSTKENDYSMNEVKDRIASGKISYVGKYSAPDYEQLLGLGCNLAIESTMIYHSPKVKEQLERLKIPVLVERSSYEEHPLGRMEWIKLYGLLLGKSEQAERFFNEQTAQVEQLIASMNEKESKNGPKVAFFYLSSNGYVNIRKPGDYISRMISIAGGRYAFEGLQLSEENALSTLNINWEDFYKEAVDADILIYNGTIDGGVQSKEDLLSKNALFGDFKAFKNGSVYCTNLNMFQETSKIAQILLDLQKVIANQTDSLVYLMKL